MADTYIDVSKYINLVPEYLRDNDGFMVFLQLMVSEFNISIDNIESFTDLLDPDKVPIKFIEYLGMYVNYHHLDRADDDFNRELLTRYRTISEMRGTDHAIIMAATHGDNEGYVGGDLFVPGYEISKDLAELTVSTEYLFVHSKSKHSSIYVFPDGDRYRQGVIVITIPYINQDIRDRIDSVIPAGIKYKFDIQLFVNDNTGDLGDYGELSFRGKNRIIPIVTHGDAEDSINNPLNLEYEANLGIESNSEEILVFSECKHNGRKRSGNIIVSDTVDHIVDMSVSALSVTELSRPFTGGFDKGIILTYDSATDSLNVTYKYAKDSSVDYDGPVSAVKLLSDNETFITDTVLNVKLSDITSTDELLTYTRKNETVGLDADNLSYSSGDYIIAGTGEYLDTKNKTVDTVMREELLGVRVSLDRQTNKTFIWGKTNNSILSSDAKMSGIMQNVYDMYVDMLYISPDDVLCDTSTLLDEKVDGYKDDFLTSDFEVEDYDGELDGYNEYASSPDKYKKEDSGGDSGETERSDTDFSEYSIMFGKSKMSDKDALFDGRLVTNS